MSPRGKPSRKQRELREATKREAAQAREIADTRTFTITEGQAGDRLDKLVALALPELSRARVQQLVDDGFVRVGGVVVKSAERPKAGLQVEVRLPVVAEPKLTPVQIGLKKLFEDQHLVVIDKPAGLSVHPGAGEPQTTLVHGLLAEIADLAGIGGELRPGIVHRLDKDTSGCLVVAKSEPVLRGLQEQFAGRKVDKRYLAIVHGVAAPQGTFDTLHGRHPTDRKRFSTKVNEGKRAVTRWTRLGERAPVKDVDLGASLVSIELLTGRTHQIRAHFADAGHPLLADELYGATRRETKLPEKSLVKQAAAAIGRQALHAHKLSFAHPITGKTIACVAPLPPELTAGLLLLGLPVRA